MFSYVFNPHYRGHGSAGNNTPYSLLAMIRSELYTEGLEERRNGARGRVMSLVSEALSGRWNYIDSVRPSLGDEDRFVVVAEGLHGSLHIASAESSNNLFELLNPAGISSILYSPLNGPHIWREVSRTSAYSVTQPTDRFMPVQYPWPSRWDNTAEAIREEYHRPSYSHRSGEDYPRLLAEAAQELGCGELLRHNLTWLFIDDELYSDRPDFTLERLWTVEHLPATRRCVDIGLMTVTVQVDRTDHRACPAGIMVALRIEVHGGFYPVPSETYNGPPTVHVEEPPSVVQSTYTRRNLVIKERENVTHHEAGSSKNLVDPSPSRRIGRIGKGRGGL